MKTISLFLNAVLIFLLVYLGCNKGFFSSCNTPENKTSIYCPKEGCETYNPNEKYGLISFKTAKFLSDNYVDSAKKYIYDGDVNTRVLDSRNIWFNLKILKNFIAFIESSACRAGCTEDQGLGVRIYYGKYPKKEDFSLYPDLMNVPDSFANHHTVFFMPTFHDPVSKKELDFDPRKTNANCGFQPLHRNMAFFGLNTKRPQQLSYSYVQQKQVQIPVQDSSTYSVLGTMQLMKIEGATGDQQNHGDVAPPPFDEGAFPTTAE